MSSVVWSVPRLWTILLLQVFENLRCYNEAETESEEDKYDGYGTTDDDQDAVA